MGRRLRTSPSPRLQLIKPLGPFPCSLELATRCDSLQVLPGMVYLQAAEMHTEAVHLIWQHYSMADILSSWGLHKPLASCCQSCWAAHLLSSAASGSVIYPCSSDSILLKLPSGFKLHQLVLDLAIELNRHRCSDLPVQANAHSTGTGGADLPVHVHDTAVQVKWHADSFSLNATAACLILLHKVRASSCIVAGCALPEKS